MWKCKYYNGKDFKNPSICFKYKNMGSLKSKLKNVHIENTQQKIFDPAQVYQI